MQVGFIFIKTKQLTFKWAVFRSLSSLSLLRFLGKNVAFGILNLFFFIILYDMYLSYLNLSYFEHLTW